MTPARPSSALLISEPSATAQAIRSALAPLLGEAGFDSRSGQMGSPIGRDLGANDLIVLLFPVVGDDRLTPAVEATLASLGPEHHGSDVLVVLTGDFTVGETPSSRVSDEAVRMITPFARSVSAVLFDTPISDPEAAAIEVATHVRAGRPFSPAHPIPAAVDTPSQGQHQVRPPALQAILDAAPGARFELDANGDCRSLELTDQRPYPRSVLTPANAAGVLELVGKLESLEDLSLAYANLDAAHTGAIARLPAGLRSLNLTGNPDIIAGVKLPLRLRSLNLAANGLGELPTSVLACGELDTLILAKNGLEQLDPSFGRSLAQLRRLTLYRNRFRRFPESTLEATELRVLNVGASPVEALPSEVRQLPNLRALGVCLTAITELPTALATAPGLETIDISKNPQLDVSNWPHDAAGRLTNSMPSWQSFA